VLCGYHGSGKTSTGWELAKHMRRQFVDLPQELQRKARSAYIRMPPWARQPDLEEIEPRLMTDLARRRDLVIALGVGSLENPDALADTQEFSYLVFLDPPIEVLLDRMRLMPEHRERLQIEGPAKVERHLAQLRKVYEESDLQITQQLAPGQLAKLILHCFYT
jgi:shikimate kinase